MEVWLNGLGIFRHLCVDDLAERIRVERHATVIAIFRLEAASVTADVRDARFLEQCNDLLQRTVAGVFLGRLFVDIRVASRYGPHDLGFSAALADQFLEALDSELLGIAG